MVTAQARRLEPGQLVHGVVRLRNSGTRPTVFAVRVTPGSSGILGFSPEAASRTVLTPRAVGPGDTVAIPVSIRLPDTPGAKSFQIAVGEADPSGMLARVLDTQVFTNLAANLNVLAFPRDPSGRIRATLRGTVPVRASGSTPFELSYQVPQDAAPGPWGVRIFLWDPRTFVPGDESTYLVRETFQGVFTVR